MGESKKLIGVIFGGNSGEHDVSIQSANTVINAFNSEYNSKNYHLVCIYIDKSGNFLGANIAKLALEKGSGLSEDELSNVNKEKELESILKKIKCVDIWYPILHGPNGEDGTIQGLFTLMRKPFVGSGVLGSALGMDKLAMKASFAAAGLPQVSYIHIDANNIKSSDQISSFIKRIDSQLGFPCFVKPANLGSSVGISKVYNQNELIKGIELASNYDKRIIIEENVNARELECAVLGKKTMRASTVGEVNHLSDWYDYETKYSQGRSQAIIPAPIPPIITKKIQELSLMACKAINVYGMARVDFFYKEDTSEILINEINTLPGFTAQSMYPLLWKASGLNLEKLVSMLVDTAKE